METEEDRGVSERKRKWEADRKYKELRHIHGQEKKEDDDEED